MTIERMHLLQHGKAVYIDAALLNQLLSGRDGILPYSRALTPPALSMPMHAYAVYWNSRSSCILIMTNHTRTQTEIAHLRC